MCLIDKKEVNKKGSEFVKLLVNFPFPLYWLGDIAEALDLDVGRIVCWTPPDEKDDIIFTLKPKEYGGMNKWI